MLDKGGTLDPGRIWNNLFKRVCIPMEKLNRKNLFPRKKKKPHMRIQKKNSRRKGIGVHKAEKGTKKQEGKTSWGVWVLAKSSGDKKGGVPAKGSSAEIILA